MQRFNRWTQQCPITEYLIGSRLEEDICIKYTQMLTHNFSNAFVTLYDYRLRHS